MILEGWINENLGDNIMRHCPECFTPTDSLEKYVTCLKCDKRFMDRSALSYLFELFYVPFFMPFFLVFIGFVVYLELWQDFLSEMQNRREREKQYRASCSCN